MTDRELETRLDHIEQKLDAQNAKIIAICTRCSIFHANGEKALIRIVKLHWPKLLAALGFIALWIKSSGQVDPAQMKKVTDSVGFILSNW